MNGGSRAREARGYLITGRVQGVGFRWWARRTAEALGLGGHVRNLPDGSVEVHVVGPVEVLEAFQRALREGPPSARVEGVESVEPDPRTPGDRFLTEAW